MKKATHRKQALMIAIFLLAFTLSLFSFGTTPAAAGDVAGVSTHLFLTVLRDYDHDAAFSVTYTDALGTHTKPYHAGMEVTAWSPVTITCTNHHVYDWSIDADVQEATIVGVGGITYPGGTGIHVKGTNTIKAFATNFGLHYINIVVIFYVEHWEIMREENNGYLLWGKVGTGKSYFAGCIANALMEQEVAVRMTNFSAILNDLTASFEGRNEYIERLCRFPLLIIDDFGMERGTEYGLEQVYNVIDSRYRSRKPLIVTTNLTLDSLQNPLDTAHARIYDRLLEMCAPILFTGENFRRETAQAKLNRLKELMK